MCTYFSCSIQPLTTNFKLKCCIKIGGGKNDFFFDECIRDWGNKNVLCNPFTKSIEAWMITLKLTFKQNGIFNCWISMSFYDSMASIKCFISHYHEINDVLSIWYDLLQVILHKDTHLVWNQFSQLLEVRVRSIFVTQVEIILLWNFVRVILNDVIHIWF